MQGTSARRRDARAIWDAGVAAVRPDRLIPEVLRVSSRGLSIEGRRYARKDFDRILVVGAGKAGGSMARAAAQALRPLRDAGTEIFGLVNVPPGAGRAPAGFRLIKARETAENLPTLAGAAGTKEMITLVRQAGPRDLVLGLISGGGSALLPLPASGLTLEDKIRTTRDLAAAGAPIEDLNLVRKHLSAVKGGRLAEGFGGLAFETLVISDIVGDPLSAIASGPTVPDPSTFADALEAVERHLPRRRLPLRVRRLLERGASGRLDETPKRLPRNVLTTTIGHGDRALTAMQKEARARDWSVLNLGARFEGETAALADAHAAIIRSVLEAGRPRRAPLCILSGGETTVRLCASPGRGGRNQEFALGLAGALARTGHLDRVTVLAAGSDGEDGPTDAAGALLDSATWKRLGDAELAREALASNNAYPLLDSLRALLKPGPSGTNVMDLRTILIAGDRQV